MGSLWGSISDSHLAPVYDIESSIQFKIYHESPWEFRILFLLQITFNQCVGACAPGIFRRPQTPGRMTCLRMRQQGTSFSLGMDKKLHPALYWAHDYLSIIGLTLSHASNKDPQTLISIQRTPDQSVLVCVPCYISNRGLSPGYLRPREKVSPPMREDSKCNLFGVCQIPYQKFKTRFIFLL